MVADLHPKPRGNVEVRAAAAYQPIRVAIIDETPAP